MKVKMLETRDASPEPERSVAVHRFLEGETYEVTPERGRLFIRRGHAETVEDPKPDTRTNGLVEIVANGVSAVRKKATRKKTTRKKSARKKE